MEHRRRHHYDRRIHKQRHRQRQRRVDIRHEDGFALALRSPLVIPALHNRRVQVKVVRHHRRAQHPDRDIQHVRVGNNRRRRNQQVLHVQPRDQHAIKQRNVKQQVQRNRRPDHLGQVAGRNGNLRADPQRKAHPLPITLAANLRQVPLRGNAQFETETLQQNRHQVGDHDDRQERVPKPRPAGNIGGPVAWVHVAH